MPPAAPRRMQPDARRESLLDAAARVVRRRPLADLRFELVAEEAGVSTPLLYRYFGSVDELAATLFDRVVGAVDRATPPVVDASADLDGAVAGVLGLWLDAVEADGALVDALLDGRAVAAVRPLIDERDRWANAFWTEALQRWHPMAAADAELVAAVLTSGATAAIQRWAARGGDREVEVERFLRVARALVGAFGEA